MIDSRRVKGVNHFNKVFVFFSMERFSHFIKYEMSMHVIKFSRERSVMIVQRNASVKSKRRVQESFLVRGKVSGNRSGQRAFGVCEDNV